jgi:hypothetical protein
MKDNETEHLGEPQAYWPDDKSTNIVCDEAYDTLSEPRDFSTENMKIICTEHEHPLMKLQKFWPEIVIGEPDTFILSQLLKFREFPSTEAYKFCKGIEFGCVPMFTLMTSEMQETFLSCFSKQPYLPFAINASAFICLFLEDCLKRAEEKAKCKQEALEK